MNSKQTVYIIDEFNKYCGDKIISTFRLNDRKYCIKECELEWGYPKIKTIEEKPYFYLYNTLDEAYNYIRKIKRLEGSR